MQDLSFDGTGQLIFHHEADTCRGPCPFHSPSDHSMVDWSLHLRADLPVPLMERICPHGVGHPDPDSLAFLAARFDEGAAYGVHGCDGCCRRYGSDDHG